MKLSGIFFLFQEKVWKKILLKNIFFTWFQKLIFIFSFSSLKKIKQIHIVSHMKKKIPEKCSSRTFTRTFTWISFFSWNLLSLDFPDVKFLLKIFLHMCEKYNEKEKKHEKINQTRLYNFLYSTKKDTWRNLLFSLFSKFQDCLVMC